MKDKLSPQDIDDLFAITTYHASSKAYHYKPQEDTLGKNMVFRHGPLKRQLYKYFPEKIVDAIYTEEKLLHLSKLIPPFPKRRPYDQERGITVSSLNFFDDLRNCGRNQLS